MNYESIVENSRDFVERFCVNQTAIMISTQIPINHRPFFRSFVRSIRVTNCWNSFGFDRHLFLFWARAFYQPHISLSAGWMSILNYTPNHCDKLPCQWAVSSTSFIWNDNYDWWMGQRCNEEKKRRKKKQYRNSLKFLPICCSSVKLAEIYLLFIRNDKFIEANANILHITK